MGLTSFLSDTFKSIPVVGKPLSEVTNWIGGGVNDIWSSATGLFSDYMGNELIGKPNAEEAYNQSVAATALAYERQKEMYKNRYRWTMEDMRGAGLNPILAVSSGMSTSGGAAPSAAQGFQAVSPYGSGASSARSFAEAGEKDASRDLKRKEILRTERQVNLLIAQTAREKGEVRLIGQNIKESKKRIDEIGARILQLKASMEELNDRGMLHQQEASNLSVLQGKIKQETENLRVAVQQIRAMLPKLEAQGGVYEGSSGTVLAYLEAIMRIIGLPLSMIGGGYVGTKVLKGKLKSGAKTRDYENFIGN